MKYEQIAAIDIGTNSFHLVVVRADSDGRYEIIGREKEAVRLGSGAGDLDFITPQAMDRGLQALRRFVQVAGSMQAPVRAVATSAVREASNQDEFIRRVKNECGLAIDVIPGTEEARLIYLGILESLPVYDDRILMIDIGGGSTEYLIGTKAVPEFAVSLKLGAIRLKDRFFASEPLTNAQVSDCRHFVRVALSGVKQEAAALGFEVAVGSSGTIDTLSEVIHPRDEEDTTLRTDIAFTSDQLDDAVDRILSETTAKKRLRIPGLDEKRSDIIVGGAILLQESFRALGIQEMRVSPTALREGVIRDTLARRSGFGTVLDIRRSSVAHLAESFHRKGMSDIESAKHTAFLACRIFEELDLAGLLKSMNAADKFILESAAMLHNIGMVVAHSAHHKHSAYIIRNSELLMGFTKEEVETIAMLARYHRKAEPSRKHADFALLSESAQKKIRMMAGILRLAIGMERSGRGLVRNITLKKGHAGIVCTLEAPPDAQGRPVDLSLEIWAASAKVDLLERVLDTKIRLDSASSAVT